MLLTIYDKAGTKRADVAVNDSSTQSKEVQGDNVPVSYTHLWVLRNFVEWRYLTAMFRTFERLMGTKDFMRIISSTARANPMTPRLSQARKGS